MTDSKKFAFSKDAARQRLELAFDKRGAQGIANILRRPDVFEISDDARLYIADILLTLNAERKALKNGVALPAWPRHLNKDHSTQREDASHRYRLFLVSLRLKDLVSKHGLTLSKACETVNQETAEKLEKTRASVEYLIEQGNSRAEAKEVAERVLLRGVALKKNGTPFKTAKSLEKTLRDTGLLPKK